ncbi:hypothetical protein I551_8790 [Mycobacterium ulcerans str. Harvey]|uniref:Uncharacterized protein n=1 Tax=Mycobacterium ulcerans str. Harvey TaxID=1299332 RepID=A0ABN0R9U1_MYCUL|nr:hypothetical protein I551_8790 [Mycobacterium ulcerans str. Harvey]
MGFARSTSDAVVFMDHGTVVEAVPRAAIRGARTDGCSGFSPKYFDSSLDRLTAGQMSG